MNRNKDAAIVRELVTSKYKIAERNRAAKLRFLNEMKKVETIVKRRDSEPTGLQAEKLEYEKIDISMPGTPVSSRYLAFMKKHSKGIEMLESDSETENEDTEYDETKDNLLQSSFILNESLKKFNNDMDTLKREHEVSLHDPLQKYFEDSDKTRTYQRNFSDVASELTLQNTDAESKSRVDQYFLESERLNSFKREFGEVYRQFDPSNPSGKDQFTELKKVGTPISSKFVPVEKTLSGIENEIVMLDHVIEEKKISQESSEPIVVMNENAEKIQSNGNLEKLQMNGNAEKPQLNGNYYKRSDSVASDISVPGTPVSSKRIFSSRNEGSYDTDDSSSEMWESKSTDESTKVRSLAKELVDEIENLIQKSIEIESEEEKLEMSQKEQTKIDTKLVDESDGNSNESFEKLSNYLNPKIENYFIESDQKKSFARNFSEAVDDANSEIDINSLTKPGTPVSSAVISRLKKKSSYNQPIEDYFNQSQERSTYRRNFSEVENVLSSSTPKNKAEIELFLVEKEKNQNFENYQRSSRASSVSSNGSEQFDISDPQRKIKKQRKKYGIDKYFAASLYRTAYQRSNNPAKDPGNNEGDLKIVEDEYIFGETDLLSRNEFQHDDETTVTQGPNDVNSNQTTEFWRYYLKPYNLNLQTEITVTKDELLENQKVEQD